MSSFSSLDAGFRLGVQRLRDVPAVRVDLGQTTMTPARARLLASLLIEAADAAEAGAAHATIIADVPHGHAYGPGAMMERA